MLLKTVSVFTGPLHYALDRMNQPDKATVYYRKALKLSPGNPQVNNNLGNLLVKKENYAEAILHFKAALQVNQNYKKAHNNIAIAYLHNSEPHKAIAHLKTALRIDPNYSGARKNLEKIEAYQEKRETVGTRHH